MASVRSDFAARIKERLTADEVARMYGFHPDRSGFIQCPFHRGDHHGSLKLYPGSRGWFCFGCRRGGNVIDFVMELMGLSFAQAIAKLNADFHLGLVPDRPTPVSARESAAMLERRRAEREQERIKAKYMALAKEHQYWLEVSKVFAPTVPDYIHPLYAEAVKRLAWLDYITEAMMEEVVMRG